MASCSINFGHKLIKSGLNLKPCRRYSSQALSWNNPIFKTSISNCKNGISLLSNKSRLDYINKTKRKSFAVYANIGAPLPSDPPPPSGSGYMSWVLGMVVTIILPFFSHKWGPLWVLKNKIENAVQMVENVAETVEKVAIEVDKIAEHIADDLPEGELKKIMRRVEHAAEKTTKTADSLDNIIDKVQEAEEKVEGAIVESIAKEEAKKSPKAAAHEHDQ